MQCPVCGHENSTSARFCENCGSQLADVPKPGPILGDVFETSQESGERRQLTILFSDIVGSTAMSSGLDPEDFHDLIVSYQQIATGAIERYGGQVAQYQGDGIVALFGYPKAHEDDAERAVRAGLKLIIDMNKLNKKVLPVLSSVSIRASLWSGPRETHPGSTAIRLTLHPGFKRPPNQTRSSSQNQHMYLSPVFSCSKIWGSIF
jgi:class 3 adenylate cyclase